MEKICLFAYYLKYIIKEKMKLLVNDLSNPISLSELFCRNYFVSMDNEFISKLQNILDKERLTAGQLFDNIVQFARNNGDLENVDRINEYYSGCIYEEKITNYNFDFKQVVNFGGNEGIYVDCYLKGDFGVKNKKEINIGIVKTLDTDLEACKIMGELCGILMYHEECYINKNFFLFLPNEEFILHRIQYIREK